MSEPQPEKIGESRAYWTHRVGEFPSPVAMGRMAQLIDFDPRVGEAGRIVYRFLINWYHHDYGDALLSQRHVARVMKQRAPDAAACPSRSAVSRAIVNLIETGWVARTVRGRGRGKSASRYVPVFNVLELAEQGRFPEVALQVGQFDEQYNWPTQRATSGETGPVERATSKGTGPAGGPKTHIQEPSTKDLVTCSEIDISPVADAHSRAAPGDGFERVFIAYAKPGDNRAKALRAFRDINPDGDEVERMVRAAESWKRTATGGRMSLERWLSEKRWLQNDEAANDNRKTHRYPSCVITKITPRGEGDDFEGAKIWFRDRDGAAHTRVLDISEYGWLQECCYENSRLLSPSDDLHEFVGARFQIDEDGFIADPTEWLAA